MGITYFTKITNIYQNAIKAMFAYTEIAVYLATGIYVYYMTVLKQV
jgi:hypothetical protein